MAIPFLDLQGLHRELEEELVGVFRECLRQAAFIGGSRVERFEAEFAAFCGTRYCVGVNSGTDALRFALLAAGIGPGDEVVTVPNTFIATAEAISQAGARPAFVDIDEQSGNLDPVRLEEYLKSRLAGNGTMAWRPRAVIPVHLYGRPAEMDPILEICKRFGLTVIEDACQAHGAEYFSRGENRWKRAGSMGLAGAFSFYPGKNLGACGEGGAVTTDDEEVARKVRMIRDHGQSRKYFHEMEGYNGRLDTIQAGMLSVKLKHLAQWNEKRREVARAYGGLLAGQGAIRLPSEPENVRPVYHLYVIRTAARDALMQALAKEGIGTGLHYPIPLHRQAAYEKFGWGEGAFPVAEKAAREILSLPMGPNLSEEAVRTVAGAIQTFCQTREGR